MKLTEIQTRLLDFVKSMHGDQKRKYTGEPYAAHLLSVAEKVKDIPYAVAVALCHDLYEDTSCDAPLLISTMIDIGYDVGVAHAQAEVVQELTDVYTKEAYPDLNRAERKKREALRLGKTSYLAQTVKYADLMDNTVSIANYDPSFAKVYLQEKHELLNQMRGGQIDLYIEACAVYKKASVLLNQGS